MTSLKPSTVVILILFLAFPQVTATFVEALLSPFRSYSLVMNLSKTFEAQLERVTYFLAQLKMHAF